MPCTPDRRLLFIHIPKTGGTSIERHLGLFGDWQIEDQTHLFGLIQSPQLLAHGWDSAFLQHLTWLEIQQQWSFGQALCFGVVRNPWARFASVYTNTDNHLVEMARGAGVALEGLPFADFVAATEGLVHAHLRPQLDYLVDADGTLVVQHRLCTEHLHADYGAFAQSHGLPVDLPWHNRSARRLPLEQLYDRSSWERIGERYSADVQALGYSSVEPPAWV